MPYRIILFVLLTVNCNAQLVNYVNARKLTVDDGLSAANVRKVIKDKLGFLWFSTQDGLNKFDGTSVVKFTSNSLQLKRRILGTDCYSMEYKEGDNWLYVLTGYEGLNIINVNTNTVAERIPAVNITGHEKSIWLKRMVRYDNTLIISTPQKIILFDIVTHKTIKFFEPALAKGEELDLIDVKGDVLAIVSTANKYYELNLKSGTTLKNIDIFPNHEKYKINSGFFKNNKIYLCLTSGLFVFDPANQRLQSVSTLFSIVPANIAAQNCFYACFVNNKLLFATAQGLFELDIERNAFVEIRDNKDNEQAGFFSSVNYVMRLDDMLVMGTASGAVIVTTRNPPFKTVYKYQDELVKLDQVYNIKNVDSNIVLVGGKNGLFLVNFSTKSFKQLFSSTTVFSLISIDSKNILFSTAGKLFVQNNRKNFAAEEVYPELAPISDEFMVNMESINDGKKIFLSSQKGNGLYCWEPVNHRLIKYSKTSLPQLNDLHINNLFVFSNEIIYIVSETEVSEFNTVANTINRVFSRNDIKDGNGVLMDMCSNSDYFFLAVYGLGIVQLDKHFNFLKSISDKTGLSNLAAYKVCNISDSLICVTTNNGLNIYNIRANTVEVHYSNEGIQDNEFNEGAALNLKRYTYIGGVKGITEIDKRNYKVEFEKPKCYFTSISLKTEFNLTDTTDYGLGHVNIPNNYLSVKISFAGLNYKFPNKLKYKYRIREINNVWNEIDQQNFVDLIGLRPGSYHLEVICYFNKQFESEVISLALNFEPKWYQTWWFYLLIALAIAAILYALYRYRIAQIKKQHEIRKNIATDLHDDLGSTLNSVKVFTNLAISGVKQEESLQQVKDNLTEATMSLRDMIWVLDDSLDTVDELITRLKQFAIPVAAASNIEATIKADSEVNSRQLTKEEKRNLFLICKEAINNSIKYSGANQITVEIIVHGKKIQTTVSDNGRGFNVDEVKKGYGLKNMQYRAGQIKYKVALTSSPGKGTRVEIKPA